MSRLRDAIARVDAEDVLSIGTLALPAGLGFWDWRVGVCTFGALCLFGLIWRRIGR